MCGLIENPEHENLLFALAVVGGALEASQKNVDAVAAAWSGIPSLREARVLIRQLDHDLAIAIRQRDLTLDAALASGADAPTDEAALVAVAHAAYVRDANVEHMERMRLVVRAILKAVRRG